MKLFSNTIDLKKGMEKTNIPGWQQNLLLLLLGIFCLVLNISILQDCMYFMQLH